MKRSRLLSFFFLLPFFCSAQNREVDSLRRLLSKATHDSTRLNLQSFIAAEYYDNQPDTALLLWKNIETEAQKKLSLYKGAALNSIQLTLGDALNNIGFVYTDRGMIGPALDYNFKSYRLRDQIHDQHGIAESLNNIAFLYLKQHDTTNALDYFIRSGKGYEAIHDSGGVAYTLTNQGMILLAQGHDSLAMVKYRGANDLFAKLPGVERGYASSLTGMGNVYTKMKRYDEALLYFRKGLDVREKSGSKTGIASSYLAIARMYSLQGKTDSALFYGLKGYALGQTTRSSDNIVAGAQLLSNIYKQRSDYRNAYDYYNIYVAARDSISTEQAGKDLVRQQLNYEYAKKSAADSVNNADAQKLKDAAIATRDLRLARDELQKYFLIGGIILLLGFALVLFGRFRVIRQQKNVIEQQKKLVEEKQKEVLDSIHYATRIQHALLAGETLLNQNLSEHFIHYRPKAIVSGDFYWASATGSKFWICAADCTGHGVPGAFMSLLNISFLNEAINEKKIGTPAAVFGHMRTRVINALAVDGSAEGGKDGMDGVLCCFDFATKHLDFACANNPLWLIRNENGVPTLQKYGPDKMPVGKHAHDQYPFTQHQLTLQPGDLVYLFTDGFADQFGGPKEKKFSYRRLGELLLAHSALPLREQEQELRKAFDSWKGSVEQIDDVLVIAIRIS